MELAEAVGVPKENILFMSTGDVVELTAYSCRITGRVQAGGIMVDGLGVGDVGNVVLRDRQNLAQNGIMIVTIALERGTNRLIAGPEIVSRGFIYVKVTLHFFILVALKNRPENSGQYAYVVFRRVCPFPHFFWPIRRVAAHSLLQITSLSIFILYIIYSLL